MINSSANIVTGTFVKELKNRFLCEVVISGIPTECYVPSSCHLSNFLELGPLQNDPKKRARFGARKGFQTSLVAIFLVCEDTE